MSKKKTWLEKLSDDKDLPKVVPLQGKAALRWGAGTMAIASPREVDALMKQVPPGHVTTIDFLRAEIARSHLATLGCPLTTGIFAWIAAHAAEEAASKGAAEITPYWRTLKARGQLNPKYPGGIKAQQARLEAEGHRIKQRGKNSFVSDFERALFSPLAKTGQSK